MKVALIGFGKAGQALYEELISNQRVRSVVVYDIDSKVLKDLPSGFSNRTVTARRRDFLDSTFDLVVIASPDSMHVDYLIEAITLNIPSFVEKPYVSTHEQLNLIRNLLVSNPRYETTSNLILRASPLFVRIRDLYKSGHLGSKLFVEGKYLYGRWEKLQNGWRGHKEYSVTLGGLIHLIDLYCYLTSNFRHRVSLTEERLTTKVPLELKDFSNILLQSELSGVCSLSTSFSVEIPHRRDISIFTDRGWIEVQGSKITTSGDVMRDLNVTPLSPYSKGALLREFIDHLSGVDNIHTHFPTSFEILSVIDISMGNSTL